jgi:transcriptional regulator with XRE-family HTH domain
MKLKDRVANKIRAIRKLRGLTQEQLAEKIDRTVFAVSQLERGLSLPSFETLERLSIVLKVPVRDFFDGGEGEEGTSPTRIRLMTTLTHSVRRLSDDDLDTTVRVVEAMWSTRRKK